MREPSILAQSKTPAWTGAHAFQAKKDPLATAQKQTSLEATANLVSAEDSKTKSFYLGWSLHPKIPNENAFSSENDLT